MLSDYRFSVAISFAGDNKRSIVRAVATILRDKLGEGRVFFDEWFEAELAGHDANTCLLYTSPSPRDRTRSRMPSSA